MPIRGGISDSLTLSRTSGAMSSLVSSDTCSLTVPLIPRELELALRKAPRRKSSNLPALR